MSYIRKFEHKIIPYFKGLFALFFTGGVSKEAFEHFIEAYKIHFFNSSCN